MFTNPLLEEKEELQQKLVRLTRISSLRRKLITSVVILVVVLAIVTAVWVSGYVQARRNDEAEILKLENTIAEKEKRIEELLNEPAVVNPVSPKISLEKVYSEVKNIGELATIEYLFTDAGKFSESSQIKNWNIPFTEKSFILKWNGTIKAGIDIEKISIEVDESDKRIVVTVPQATILTYETDVNSTELLDEKNNIFNPVTIDDKLKFDIKTQEAITERAIENGLLEKAQDNAQDVLLRLLTFDPAIGNEYTIEFVTAAD